MCNVSALENFYGMGDKSVPHHLCLELIVNICRNIWMHSRAKRYTIMRLNYGFLVFIYCLQCVQCSFHRSSQICPFFFIKGPQ